jgi:hypothetical protein
VEKMIQDFTNINVYEKDLMQPEMRKYMKGV